MWILFVFAIYNSGVTSTATEISTREKCLNAANFAKKRVAVFDAFCVQK